MRFPTMVQIKMAKPKGLDTLRVAGLLDDNETVAVATMRPDASAAAEEQTFTISDAAHLAERCLAGDPAALSTPGLARILSASVAILFRVSIAGGSIIKQRKDAGAYGHHQHREASPADEHSG